MSTIKAGEGRTWPEVRVVETGFLHGPQYGKRNKWVALSCGHTVHRQRRPLIGATIVCNQSEDAAAGDHR